MQRKKLLAIALLGAFSLNPTYANENLPISSSMAFVNESSASEDFLMIARQAVQNNPEVAASWHAFISSNFDIDFARGGNLPTLDLVGGVQQNDRNYSINGSERNFTSSNIEVLLRQSLFNGQRVRNEISQTERTQLVRYYELLADIERITYATFEAYQDVAKQRELVRLAEQNLQAHRIVQRQVQRAVDAGVGRQADLDQINGRVALAETNASTERANLHDVSARYLRIVGTQPPAEMSLLKFSDDLVPVNVMQAINTAYTSNPSFLASMRNIEAEEKNELRQRSNYMPEIDLTGRYGLRDSDDVGNTFSDLRRDARIGIEARFNLYRGGRDAASINRAMEQINVAKSLRDKSCVDVRQEVQISFNDGLRLTQELPNLERHKESADRVRLAYRDQFDLGQRTLLDLLTAESEYFEASRALANAQYDLNIAQARLQANTGSLVNNLGITRDQLPTLEDLGATRITNPGTFCPVPENIDTFVEVPLEAIPEPEPEDFGFVGEDLTAELNVQFEYRSATVRPEFMGEVERLARFMERNPQTNVEIAGHASLDGTRVFNQRLSQQRANSVAALLVNRYDIDPRRISAVGYGVTQPIINEISPTANEINRRTEARITVQ